MSLQRSLQLGITPIVQGLSIAPRLSALFEQRYLGVAEAVRSACGQVPGPAWLREGTLLAMPLLRCHKLPPVQQLVEDLMARQAEYVAADGRQAGDAQGIAALCFPIWLAMHWYERSGRMAWLNDGYRVALTAALKVLCAEDALVRLQGRIPHTLFAAHTLKGMALFFVLVGDSGLTAQARAQAECLNARVAQYGPHMHPRFGEILCSTDDAVHYDDAVVPGLLALPYLGAMRIDDPLYLRTRAFLLSGYNPAFVPSVPVGFHAEEAVALRALTTLQIDERAHLLGLMVRSAENRPQGTVADSLFTQAVCLWHDEGMLADIIARAGHMGAL